MKLSEMYAERSAKITEMKKLSTLDMTDELRTQFDGIESEITVLNRDIERAEAVERLNKMSFDKTPETSEPEKESTLFEDFRSFLTTGKVSDERKGPQGGFLLPFERGVLQTTTNSGIINKTVSDELVIAKTPAEALLEKLGVRKYTGLNGQFVVPSMAQVAAGFAAETVAVADASGTPTSLTMSPRRLGAYAIVTKETINSTNPSIWNGIINDIRDAWYRAQVADLFDQLETDAVDASTVITGSTITYADIVNLQAGVPYDLARPSFVATPAVAAKLKQSVKVTGVTGPVWEGALMEGSIDGIPSFATTLANTKRTYFADFSKAIIAEWGSGIEVMLNPYTYDLEGEVKVVISGQTDTGFANYRFAKWIADSSV